MGELPKTHKQKIVLLGDFAVGKTSLINRYVYNVFSEKYIATLGVRVSKKEINLLRNNKNLNITILLWDINSEDKFQRVLPQYITGANGAIIVADVTRTETITNLINHIEYFRSIVGNKAIVLSYNKIDLLNEKEKEQINNIIKHNNTLSHIESFFTSAKENENVEKLFIRTAEIALTKRHTNV